MASRTVTLDSETDWSGFRHEARALFAASVPPGEVEWHTPASRAVDLFSASSPAEEPARIAQGAVNLAVPSSFVTLCQTVSLHNDPARFGLL